jgi:hypothetical protein
MAGHGDRDGSIWLCDKLKSMGGDVEQLWPTPEQYYVWGERERTQLVPIFDWVERKDRADRSKRPSLATAEAMTMNRSVKASLLKGFAVRTPEDSALVSWMTQWSLLWASFRGTSWSQGSFGEFVPTSVVTGRVLNARDIQALQRGSFFIGKPQLQTPDMLYSITNDQLWGFRLTQSQKPTVVEVFRSQATSGPMPNIDLVVDGCCQGALWKKVDGNWVLADVWL